MNNFAINKPARLHFAEIDSTNAHARKIAEAGEIGPVWISADKQTNGRGRQGRDWVSQPGNLFATYLLTLPISPAVASQIGFVACMAVFDAAASFVENKNILDLKWPNDVLLDGKKLAGILTETLSSQEVAKTCLAIGIGVNLKSAPANTPYGAVGLSQFTNSVVSPDMFLHELINSMASWLKVWDCGSDFSKVKDGFLQRAGFLNKTVSIHQGDQIFSGRFTGLANGGELVLQLKDGTKRTFSAGDVSLRRTGV